MFVAAGERERAVRQGDGGRVAAVAHDVLVMQHRVVELDGPREMCQAVAMVAEDGPLDHTTGVTGSSPLSTAMTLSAHNSAIASRVARVADPMCGTQTVFASATSASGTAGSSS